MNKPFLNITRVDLKGVERALNRIAFALEVAVGLPHPSDNPVESTEPAVAFSSEDDLIRQEFAALRGDLPVEREP